MASAIPTRAVVLVLTVPVFVASTQETARWTTLRHAQYSVFYKSGYQADAKFAQQWLNRTEDLMKVKYRITTTGYHIDFYLHTEPNEQAGVGKALNVCCTAQGTGTIHYLTPSAPAWKTTPRQTSLGLPYDDNYHAKVIVSEYIPTGHYAVQDGRSQSDGWSYYAAPEWFYQGLQEYDAIFHSTKFNRRVTRARLIDFGRKRVTTFACCPNDLPQIADTYNGGALFAAYLAERFGEDIHRKLLQNSQPTFASAFTEEIRPLSVSELFVDFQRWLAAAK